MYKAKAFANQFIADRAAVAHAAGKPYILEETGKDVRPPFSNSLAASAAPRLRQAHPVQGS